MRKQTIAFDVTNSKINRKILLHVLRNYTINADEIIDNFISSGDWELLEIWIPFADMELIEVQELIENEYNAIIDLIAEVNTKVKNI